MSDVVKWGLLGVGAVLLIGLIFALPFVQFIDLTKFSENIAVIVNTAGDYLRTARGIINLFLPPFGRTVLTGIMGWLIGKTFLMNGIKIITWAYHFIFRG